LGLALLGQVVKSEGLVQRVYEELYVLVESSLHLAYQVSYVLWLLLHFFIFCWLQIRRCSRGIDLHHFSLLSLIIEN